MDINPNATAPAFTGRPESQPRREASTPAQTETAVRPSQNSESPARSSGSATRGRNVDIVV